MKSKKNNPNLNEAFEQLEKLVGQLEEGAFPLEELPKKIKLANKLTAICEDKLRKIKDDLNP